MKLRKLTVGACVFGVLVFGVAASPAPEFQAFLEKAQSGDPVVIAYLGGSITRGAATYPAAGTNTAGETYDFSAYNTEKGSWRALSYEWLRSEYEKTPGQFRQVNAAIGGTPSLLGAYRLDQDVLSQSPDLVFVEFAVNDGGVSRLTRDAPKAPRSILRTTRSIVERLREQNPNVAILMPLSPHRVLEGSAHSPWAEVLDLGHDQMRWSAESLQVPYVSLREAFYGDSGTQPEAPYYDGPDTPGNYVHPSPHGHKAYADAVENVLKDIFATGSFAFQLPKTELKVVPSSPRSPRLILPEMLVAHSKGWAVEMPEKCEAPILEGHPCLVSSAHGALEYTFNGTAVALWFDIQSTGVLEIYLDGKKVGSYANRVKGKAKYQGRFCSLADSLDASRPHTLRLVPVSEAGAAPSRILLRAVAIDAGLEKRLKVGKVELIYTEDEIPIRYDGSLSTIRQNGEMHFFHSFGCRFPPIEDETRPKVRRSRHSWHKGTPKDPLKVHLMSKTEAELWDYNGYYQDDNLEEEGIWILGMYECSNGDLLAITHAEFNARGEDQRFALGLGYSVDRGASWIYCGEIVRPAEDRQNVGGGAYIVRDGFLYVYYNDISSDEEGPTEQNRIQCVARANLDEVIEAAAQHRVTRWHKYAHGTWEVLGLSNQPGDDIIPHVTGGEDLHADAAYCTALEKYLLTIQTHANGKLLLFSSPDGLDWSLETTLDHVSGGALQPYSSFVDFDGPSTDGHIVDGDFYIYFPRKGPNHEYDDMYRCKITIEQ